MVVLIALVTFNVCPLAYGGVIVLLIYLFIRALSPRQLINSIRGNILLIIAGALAISQGLQKSGIVTFLTSALMSIGKPLGEIGIHATIYLLIWALGLFINNSAVVAIVGPVVVDAVQQNPDLNIKALDWTLIYAAGTCFSTPLGYQTNLMVMEDGQYTFTDFARFGGLIQACHFVLVIMVNCFLLKWTGV